MPYSTFLQIHIVLASLYVLFFVIKFILLLSANQNALINFRRRTQLLEMVLPILLIITGIILVLKTDYTTQPWFMVKLVSLLLAIVTGIYTFKNNSIGFGIATLGIFVYIFFLSYAKSPDLKIGKSHLNETETIISH